MVWMGLVQSAEGLKREPEFPSRGSSLLMDYSVGSCPSLSLLRKSESTTATRANFLQ